MAAATESSFDAVGTAALFGAVAGGLSVLFPFFDGLTAALMALLMAAWLGDRSRATRTFHGPTPVTLGALASWGAGWVDFLGHLPAVDHLHALLLGAAGLPLWWESRMNRASAGAT
jgi:TctA family transporter